MCIRKKSRLFTSRCAHERKNSSRTDVATDFNAGEPSLIGCHRQFHSLHISSAGVHGEVLGKQHPYRALAHVHVWRKPITGSIRAAAILAQEENNAAWTCQQSCLLSGSLWLQDAPVIGPSQGVTPFLTVMIA